MARALSRGLRADGWDVEVCETIRSALREAGPFRLAVLDVDLPDGTGVELARQLLDRGTVRRVVFFSATTDDRTVEDARSIGRFVGKLQGIGALREALHATGPGGGPPETSPEAATGTDNRLRRRHAVQMKAVRGGKS